MMTPEIETTLCHVRGFAVNRRTVAWVPQMIPNCMVPRIAIASVGGVMLVTPSPGIPTIATG